MAAITTPIDERPELSTRPPSWGDKVRVQSVLKLRRFHARTIERASAGSYRRRALPSSDRPRVRPAGRGYERKGMGWLPAALVAPTTTPKSARVPMLGYYLPYYATSKIAWTLWHKSPISADLPWSGQARWDQEFPGGESGWGVLDDDDAFAALRLQGPNPFLLRRDRPRPDLNESPEAHMFVCDYEPHMRGFFVPVTCRFEASSPGADVAIWPTSISIDSVVVRPGDRMWERAKRIANALDARYSVFSRHLLETHLIVGQAYALSAYSLPVWHRLRSFLDFFTYGTLPVNDAAYQSLLTPQSYFLMAGFVGREDAPAFVDNIVREFDLSPWQVPLDLSTRGLDTLDGHPYAHDATRVWDAITGVLAEFVDELFATDEEVTEDPDLRRWYADLRTWLVASDSVPTLDGKAGLVSLLAILLYNNVIHEVCGNLAPLAGHGRGQADPGTVNIESLRTLAASITNATDTGHTGDTDGWTEPAAAAGDVFLIDQAIYTSRFNVGGNNLLQLDADAYTDDPKTQVVAKALQRALGEVDNELGALDRPVRFSAMLPRKWEASISF